jgi:3-oxoacyl-[acyl-carrier-protein] synthase II
MKFPHRVVVTGLGAVTPLGISAEESWKNALAGQSGIAPITRFPAETYEVRIAGEVKNFDSSLYIEKKEQKKMDQFIHYAVGATKMALDNSGLDPQGSWREKAGVLIGAGMGGLPAIEEQHSRMLEKGPGRISPFFIPMVIGNMAAGQVSIQFGLQGPNYALTSACASGAHSIGEAYRYLREGSWDVMVAGGAESTICGMALGGFGAMRALSTRNEEPTRASRPYDQDRDGFVIAEGAGILILETLEHALNRGADILAEVVGYGMSADAYHMTNPAPEGAGAARAMTYALKDAELNPEQIQYINTHGTSTPVGDELETLGIKSVFKEYAKKGLWVSSTKSMMGHALGAAGAIESVFCVQALRDQAVPPTINLENPSPACDLDYVAKESRQGKLQYVLNNSFGFGGTNACLIFSRFST